MNLHSPPTVQSLRHGLEGGSCGQGVVPELHASSGWYAFLQAICALSARTPGLKTECSLWRAMLLV